jgi:5-methylcytosine-specific restriction endonuclease McrA
MSATVDHIIPVSKGGHPSAMDNLQLAHWICNRLKSNKLLDYTQQQQAAGSSIKLSCDWKNF